MIRSAWMATLARLIAPWSTGDVAKKLIAMLGAVQHLPDDAFSAVIAQGVADRLGKGLPSSDRLVQAMETEFRAVKPAAARQAQLEGGVDQRIAEFSYTTQVWIHLWNERAAAGFCPCGSNSCPRTIRHTASIIRSYDRSGRAWPFIRDVLEGRDRLADMFRMGGWTFTDVPHGTKFDPELPEDAGASNVASTPAVAAASDELARQLRADYGVQSDPAHEQAARDAAGRATAAPPPPKPLTSAQLAALYRQQLARAVANGDRTAEAYARKRIDILEAAP